MERIDILKAAFGASADKFEENLVADSKAQFEACQSQFLYSTGSIGGSVGGSTSPPYHLSAGAIAISSSALSVV